MYFNINTNSSVVFTNKLEKLHRSALPVAVRGTLNDMVFDVKTKTMPASSFAEFEHREKNFFKANSKFAQAQGFNIKSMEASVGFYENKLKNQSTNFAVKDLEQQESGGNIEHKAFIPMKAARKGAKGIVRANARMDQIGDHVIDAKKVRSISGHSAPNLLNTVRKQKLIRAAIKAHRVWGNSAYVLGNPNAAGRQTLFKVEDVYSLNTDKNRKLHIKLTALYNVKKGRSVNVQKTGFMHEASINTVKKSDDFYINQALKQLRKAGVIK